MFEKVNPAHPDKIADRIAGALVDLAYKQEENPRIAVEVLIGHGICHIISETSVALDRVDVGRAVARIAGPNFALLYNENQQDAHLAKNQAKGLKCGDNGIFKGVPTSLEEDFLGDLARQIYARYPTDGKYIVDGNWLTICQSKADAKEMWEWLDKEYGCDRRSGTINPLGAWTGGPNVDTGATNRKLGSDMGRSVTGGGLHGKDLSKADVSVNIYAFLKAQETEEPVELMCSIGDTTVGGKPYEEIVEVARDYIKQVGGFEKFAEWGLI